MEEEIPQIQEFRPRALTPCLEEGRRQKIVSRWVGNCGCTCLCPGGPR